VYNRDVEVQLHKDCCCHSCTLAVQLMKMQEVVIYKSLLYVCAPTCKHNHCCNFGTEWNMCTSPESVPNQNENPIEKGLMCVCVCMYVYM